MLKKEIWLARETTKEQKETIKEIAPNYELIEGWDKGKETTFSLENVEIVYGWNGQRSDELLKSPHTNLKWIQNKAAGVDFLDLESLKEKNVLLTSGSGIYSIPIAESVFGMLLAYTRGIKEAVKNQLTHTWDDSESLIEVHGKTIIIVGTGSIGTEIGRVAKAFNMKTIGINSNGHAAESMDETYSQEELKVQASKADILVNCLPLTKKTTYFYNDEMFESFKNKTLFINIGRGQSVEEPSLIRALDNGKVAFAGLDVFDQEPLAEDSPLWNRKEILITPHTSGFTEKLEKRLFAIFETNLKAYIANKELPLNKIDYKKNY